MNDVEGSVSQLASTKWMFGVSQYQLGTIRATENLALVPNLWLGNSFAAFTWLTHASVPN